MNSLCNASKFAGVSAFRDNEFESLLVCCVTIYNEFIANNCKCENKEKSIRDVFFERLNDDNYRTIHKILLNYHFERETQENTGVLDIKVKTLNQYRSTKAFYSIECKRLGTDKALNTEYIKNGICRFANNDYYSSFFGCNAMFGFLINKVCVQTDIIDNINLKLDKQYKNTQGKIVCANAIQKLQYYNFADGYAYSYKSTHQSSSKEITLYHLLFDFSNNIV